MLLYVVYRISIVFDATGNQAENGVNVSLALR